MNKKFARILLGFMLISGIFMFGSNASAASYNSAEQKIFGYGIYHCYSNTGVFKSPIDGLSNISSYKDVISDGGPTVYYPNTGTSNSTVASSTCRQLFAGYSNGGQFVRALLPSTVTKDTITNDNSKRNLLTSLGYTSTSSKQCATLAYQKNGTYAVNIGFICSSDGTTKGGIVVEGGGGGPLVSKVEGNKLKIYNQYDNQRGSVLLDTKSYSSIVDLMSGASREITQSKLLNPNFNLGQDMYSVPLKTSTEALDRSTNFALPSNSGIKMAGTFIGTSFENINSFKFTPNELYSLYYKYLKNYYGMTVGNGIICDYDEGEVSYYSSGDYASVPIVINGEVKLCYASGPTKNENKTVNGLDNFLFTGAQKTWRDLVREMTDVMDSIDPSGVSSESAIVEGEEPNCMNSGAVDSLGWILCPILELLSDAAQGIYGLVEESLQVDPQLFSQDNQAGTKIAWGIFQNFANIIFVIALLVIIFSQLSGVGIDNYGIKKTLPKLIVAVILVNLSYYICLICVDLSNIVGNGIQNMFNSLPVGTIVTEISTEYGGLTVNADAGTGGLISVALLGGIVGGIFALGNISFALVLSLLVSAIGVVVSIFFLFILLAARQAAIVVLVVLSPVALVLYMLPNSKKYFKSFVKIGSSMLLLYPICSLVVGGGGYVSRLLMSSGFAGEGLTPALTSIVIGIAPIFFIPSLVRNAMNGIAGLGTKISSFGKNLASGSQRAIRNNQGFKNMQDEANRQRQINNATRTAARLRGLQSTLQGIDPRYRLSDAQTRRLANAEKKLKSFNKEDAEARTAMVESEFRNRNEDDLQDEWREAFANGDAERLDALTNVLNARYGTNAATFMSRELAGARVFGNDGRFVNNNMERSFRALSENMRDNSTFAANMKNKNSDAFQMLSGDGYYRDQNGTLYRGNLADHSAHNAVSTEMKDWATQSNAALQRAVASGALTQEMAQQLLSSEDNAIRSGIASDPNKRATLEAAAGGYHGTFGNNDRAQYEGAANNYRISQAHAEALVENQRITAERAAARNNEEISNTLKEINNKLDGNNNQNPQQSDPLSRYSDETRRAIEENGGGMGA